MTRWAKRVLLAPIRWYRRVLSPMKRTPSCRYLPTCSEYAIEAIETRGALRGGAMAVWRILRCNPLFHGGYHPVCPSSHAHEERR
jgi:putative membrane protein insertion efficiency factor